MTKRPLLIPAIVAASALFSASGMAAEKDKTPGSGPSPYTDCGIGAALFPTTHWAAVTSNVIWDIGTTAVTSATMSPETCNGKKKTAALFIERNYELLVEEMARGKGEHLVEAFAIFGCSASGQAPATAQARSAVSKAVSTEGYEKRPHLEKAATLYLIVEGAANSSCSA